MPQKIRTPEKKRTSHTGLQRLHRVDERNRRIVPLPALPETAQPERDEEAQAADHDAPEAPVGQRVAVQLGVPHARHDVIGAGDGEEREAAEQRHVRVAGNPVGLRDDGVHAAQAVHGSLEAGEQVEHRARHQKLQRHVLAQLAATGPSWWRRSCRPPPTPESAASAEKVMAMVCSHCEIGPWSMWCAPVHT